MEEETLWCLCLHGSSQTAEIFQHQMSGVEKALSAALSSTVYPSSSLVAAPTRKTTATTSNPAWKKRQGGGEGISQHQDPQAAATPLPFSSSSPSSSLVAGKGTTGEKKKVLFVYLDAPHALPKRCNEDAVTTRSWSCQSSCRTSQNTSTTTGGGDRRWEENEEEDFSEGDRYLDEALQARPYTFLLGFSQGAAMIARSVVRHGGRVPTGGPVGNVEPFPRGSTTRWVKGFIFISAPNILGTSRFPRDLVSRAPLPGSGPSRKRAGADQKEVETPTATTMDETKRNPSLSSPCLLRSSTITTTTSSASSSLCASFFASHRTTSFHLIGEKDTIIPMAESVNFAKACGPHAEVSIHSHAHGVPQAKTHLSKLVGYMTRIALAEEEAEEEEGMVTEKKQEEELRSKHPLQGHAPSSSSPSEPPFPSTKAKPGCTRPGLVSSFTASPAFVRKLEEWKESREDELEMLTAMYGEEVVTRYSTPIPVKPHTLFLLPFCKGREVALAEGFLSLNASDGISHGNTTKKEEKEKKMAGEQEEEEEEDGEAAEVAALRQSFSTIAACIRIPLFQEDVWAEVEQEEWTGRRGEENASVVGARERRWLEDLRLEIFISPVYPGVPSPTAVRVGSEVVAEVLPPTTTPTTDASCSSMPTSLPWWGLPPAHGEGSSGASDSRSTFTVPTTTSSSVPPPHCVLLEKWKTCFTSVLRGYLFRTLVDTEPGTTGVLPLCLHALELATSATLLQMAATRQREVPRKTAAALLSTVEEEEDVASLEEENHEVEEGIEVEGGGEGGEVVRTLASWLRGEKSGHSSLQANGCNGPTEVEETTRKKEGKGNSASEDEARFCSMMIEEEGLEGSIRLTRAVEGDRTACQLLQRSAWQLSSNTASRSCTDGNGSTGTRRRSGGSGIGEGPSWMASALELRSGRAGRWKIEIGLIGKPSAGKSTFFNGITDPQEEAEAAAVAAFPFTTIAPNTGTGYAPLCACPCVVASSPSSSSSSVVVGGGKESHRRCTAVYGHVSAQDQVEAYRRYPVRIKDVAGLVKGAYQGRGKGNQFLNDLCEADVLVHVVDGAGATEADGTACPVGEGSAVEDITWVRAEVHFWIYDNLASKWSSIRRQPSRLVQMFSGYGSGPAFVEAVLRQMGVGSSHAGGVTSGMTMTTSSLSQTSKTAPTNTNSNSSRISGGGGGGVGGGGATGSVPLSSTTTSTTTAVPLQPLEEAVRQWDWKALHVLVALYIRLRFPIVVALNKADLQEEAKRIEKELRNAYPEEWFIPMSAGVEWDLLQLRKRKLVHYISGSTSFELVSQKGSSSSSEKKITTPSPDLEVEETTKQKTKPPAETREEEQEEEEEETRRRLKKGLKRALVFFQKGKKWEMDAPKGKTEEIGVGPTGMNTTTTTTGMGGTTAASSFDGPLHTTTSFPPRITTGVQNVLAAALASCPTTIVLPVSEDLLSLFSFPSSSTSVSSAPAWDLPHTLCFRYGTTAENVFTSLEHMGLVDGKLVRFEVLAASTLASVWASHSSPSPSLSTEGGGLEEKRGVDGLSPSSSFSFMAPGASLSPEALRKHIIPMRRTDILPAGVLLVRVLTNKFRRPLPGSSSGAGNVGGKGGIPHS